MEFSSLTWLTGFITTLILPLIILLGAHGVLRIPLEDSQGTLIFLFFGWVTSSQAILTLYRLRAVASWKVAASMLLTLFLVVLTYLLAAESFTHFLYPNPGEVAYYFKGGALPAGLFDFLVTTAAVLIILGWIFIYAKSHGRTIAMPQCVNLLQVRLYLLFMNRLYLDSLSLRVGRYVTRLVQRLDTSRAFLCVATLIALGLALLMAASSRDLSGTMVARFVIVAFLLPLFPLHVVYVEALTRLRGYLAICAAIVLPMLGLYGTAALLPEMPAEFLSGVSVLALFGALYGSLKAVAQRRMTHIVAYASVAFFSVLWWCLAVTHAFTSAAVVYATSVVLITAGLLLAWDRVHVRYGDLTLDRIGGLARPMPRFATLLALLVMAAVGLPPFGLFSGYVGMLLHASLQISWDVSIILLTWLSASWYLFKMMQRLLFGPHRADILYEDLRHAEIVPLVIILLTLVATGITPYGLFQAVGMASRYGAVMETMPWNR